MADASKTEQATPRHRKRARERGQVTRSRDLSGALSMAAAAGILWFMGREAVPRWSTFYRNALQSAQSDSIEPGGPLLYWSSIEIIHWVLPVLIGALAVALITGLAQGGFIFAPESLAPKAERLSPAGKLRQMISPAGLSAILRSLVPFNAIIWIGFSCVRGRWGVILGSSYSDSRPLAGMISSLLLEICWKCGLVLLAWSVVDYLLLWRKNEGDLKMSRQEIKDEIKESEGNLAGKARIRRLQRQSRRKQMLKAAELATVVVTNPTHYAVALRYAENMIAPIVVAKGLDVLASKIREIANQHDIPIVENRPLAQALYKGVEVGDSIPAALYHAVAEVLVMVYKAQAEVKAREARRRNSAQIQGLVRPI
ncbi:MAG TPA: EscU/YscU/HrcU family type III secretion system export apparatus switch protein [Edaphobacter sp.]|jgi:flagellar biosynthetic protein FlhB|uniref:EscU/YscU/HrcU family type III secretion system export apparatus switch protein n=1 Tax=Edaphobacter sp. TaxID=1934404 RepID=UPI002CE88951|nr:EscU/YscU/HrcU family type III secretion system export apparatus switch protein [Edaphobacter sp.]HUZ94101.1 EscU/YscU/HrcU family type III secretion system export apparatus switch protein [Edaphobacter sp.]